MENEDRKGLLQKNSVSLFHIMQNILMPLTLNQKKKKV